MSVSTGNKGTRPNLSRLLKLFYKTLMAYTNGKTVPAYLIFFVTSRCVCKCSHCFNWQRAEQKKDDLTLSEIEKISKSIGNLEFLFLTGGEPHLREDLAEIARIFYLNNKVIRLQSPTSGFDPDRIVKNVEKILKYCPGIQFGHGVSFDAIGEDHDFSRGVNGLFNSAVETFKGLKKLENKYSNFGVCNPIAVTAYNQDKVYDLYKYLKEELNSENIFCNYVRGNVRDVKTKNLDVEKYRLFAEMIDSDLLNQKCLGYTNVKFNQFYNAKNIFTRRIVYKIMKENKFQIPCMAGRMAGVLYENGDVHPCELLDEKFGNVRDNNYDFRSVWFSETADNIRARIKKEKCFCTHECFLTTSLLFNPYWLFRCLFMAFRLTIFRWLRN